MASSKVGPVHVCSLVPGLANTLRLRLPEVLFIDVPITDQSEKSIAEKLVWHVGEKEVELLKTAEILIMEGRPLVQLADKLPRAKWVQLTITGVDRLFRQTEHMPKPKFMVTRNTGEIIGQILAEYVVGHIVSQERSWTQIYQNQLCKSYNRGDEFSLYRSLRHLTIGILGIGAMGLEVARALKYFRCRIVGFSRNKKMVTDRSHYIDTYWHTGQLPSFLKDCDYIVNVLPSTPRTRGLLGADVLRNAKKSPVFINVGRGDVIAEHDLLKALESHWISGAVLDVVEKEPLPKESLLWTHPKVIITPHVAGFGNVNNRLDSIVDCFMANYQRYIRDKPLLGVIDWEAGY